MMPGHEGSLPFEEIMVLLPLQDCHPIAFWADHLDMKVDGAPPSVMPHCHRGNFLLFTETPFCFLSTTYTHTGTVASSFILMRLSVRNGFCHRLIKSSERSMLMWNVSPERFLLESAKQPPVLLCVVCRGWIRERRHADLSGRGARERSDHGCSGKHCLECRAHYPRGPYSVCEFCFNVGLGPTTLTQLDITEFDKMQTIRPVCLHHNSARNDILLTLFQIIRPEEIRAAASFFKQFFLHGTWIAELAPDDVLDNFKDGNMDQLWHAFYRSHVTNSFCPRVLAACYGMQCALDTGPVLARSGSKLAANQRELFFAGMLSAPRNQKGMHECVRDRVILATEFEQGLFEKRALMRMALRVLKLFSVDKFVHNFQCSCSVVFQANNDTGDCVNCQGPILSLAEDKGQRHTWPVYRPKTSNAGATNLALLRTFQEALSNELDHYPMAFDDNRHYTYPYY